MNRQTKRQMARQGTDPRAPGGGRARTGGGSAANAATTRGRSPAAPARERVGPTQYFSEVRSEMRKVAWPTRSETLNSSLVVLIAVIVMTSLIFLFDYGSSHFVNFLFG
jgi:preprotein translocase subunit SecE